MRKLSVHIETFGCQMNVSDSERVATNLLADGFQLTEGADSADVILLNTCSIREKAEQKVFRRVLEIKRDRAGRQPLVGVLGCVAQLEGEAVFNSSPSVQLVAGTGATDRIASLLNRVRGGERRVVDLDEHEEGAAFEISPTVRHSKHVAFVPIIEGCNKFCTYCIVPYSRGRERSRPAFEIVEEVRRLGANGFKEVHLIGQNVNSYRPRAEKGLEGFSGATPFSRLLRAVAATGVPRIKFTTSFPRDFHADIVKAIEEYENLCKWVHLPVQSGNNRILRAMRRGHKVEEYLERIAAVKNSQSEISLTSDIIVGFPGETDEEFEDTLRLAEKSEFHGLYIFKYSKRRGTPAAKLNDNVSTDEKTRRFLALESLQMSIQSKIYRSYVGKIVEVLAEAFSARSGSDLTGHTPCNKVVNFGAGAEFIGKVLKVRVTEAKAHSLFGQILQKG
ncbi:MAG: tRNA-2-methylthio-N6-dimethylallyladenosine synthase [Acidobacteriota bacterium]|jgi:tRNA-2-methylthio-N6-dimethylallyladenosine synthase|nr:tRNA-2-methylthio-N6-dimethylallyladenosine synthase [Acidobacteriota bacterium]